MFSRRRRRRHLFPTLWHFDFNTLLSIVSIWASSKVFLQAKLNTLWKWILTLDAFWSFTHVNKSNEHQAREREQTSGREREREKSGTLPRWANYVIFIHLLHVILQCWNDNLAFNIPPFRRMIQFPFESSTSRNFTS